MDKDPDALAAYAPALEGVFSPVWMMPGTNSGAELRRLGVQLQGDGFSIPLFAVLDRRQRVVAQGVGSDFRGLPRTLDTLLQ